MFQDAQLLFSDAQALTATAVSTNVIDFSLTGTLARDIGAGEDMVAVITVDVAADAGSADETYQFTVQSDDSAAFASPKNCATILFGALPSVPRAELSAGSIWLLPVMVGPTPEQFYRLNYTLGGTTPLLTITACLMPASMAVKYRSYAKSYTIS